MGAAHGEALNHYLEFLNFSSQGRVGADMLEERRLKANPQVGFLPVTVFLKDRKGTGTTHNLTTTHPCSTNTAMRLISLSVRWKRTRD